MKFIGITGSIGSGKTTICQILKQQGYVVYDVDRWCRQMYYNKDFLKIIKQNFPFCFNGDFFNKKMLRNHVFKNKKDLQKLENLTHPYLINKLKKHIHHLSVKKGLCFIEATLLYQLKLERFFNFVILTYAPYDVLKKRVVQRDQITNEQFDDIIKNQTEFLSFKNKADIIINTDVRKNLLKVRLIEIINKVDKC